MPSSPHEANWYEKLPDQVVLCHLCAHGCRILPGKRGICQVRENREGTLYSLVYGSVIAEHNDPIEKKPLFHFLPGSRSWSIATAGCNLRCGHCQNWEISLEAPRMSPIPGRDRTPAQVAETARDQRSLSISFTYTEPTVFLEFVLDCAREGKARGLGIVLVSNAFMSHQAREASIPLTDAANFDLKGATEEHYRTVCGAHLGPVKETIAEFRARGVWVEVTTLLIPGLNDDPFSLASIAEFLASVDPLMPWHVSRYFPTYKMTDRPPTPLASLERAVEAGKKAGLAYIYPGNASGLGGTTKCHKCQEPLILRDGFLMLEVRTTQTGNCPRCGTKFQGVLDLEKKD